jgi:hypothetical protein
VASSVHHCPATELALRGVLRRGCRPNRREYPRNRGRGGTRSPGGDCAGKYQVGLTMSATNFATTRPYESVMPVPADLSKSVSKNSLRAVSGAVAKW